MLPESSREFLLDQLSRNKPKFSIITEIELLSWQKISESESEIISSFLSNFSRIELSEEVKKETIRIRKSYGIKVPDSIIAASALVHNQTLLTHNIKDFKKVDGLILLDPLDLR